MKNRNLSRKLAEFTVEFSIDAVPNDVLEYAKLHVMDAVGCAIAAVGEPHAKMIAKALRNIGGSGNTSLWGIEQKATTADAVIYNGSLIHGLDYDDTHALAITHPSASVVDCAITVGEAEGKDGRAVLEAIILGYEILIRLGNAAHGKFHDIGYHPTGIISSFAAACIAGKLQNASADEIEMAIGLCGSQAAALQEYLHDGTWNKKIHPGWGVHSALYSLAMAKEGFLGAHEILEGSYGFYQTHLGSTEGLIEEFDDLGERWVTREIAFKFYPTCHWTHSDMDILLRLMKKYKFTKDDIEKIECLIDPRGAGSIVEPPERKTNPDTEYQMRFSLFYAVAVAAVRGKLTPKEINLEMMNDPMITEMIKRVKVTIDPDAEVPGHFPGHIRVTLKDGRKFDEAQPYETGCLENPAKLENVLDKFNINVTSLVGDETAKKLVSYISDMENMGQINELIHGMKVC